MADVNTDVVEARKWALGVLWGAKSEIGGPLELVELLPWAEALAQWALTGEFDAPKREAP